MRYFIYIPGMAADAHVMENLSLGGSESSGMYLSRELAMRGHDVVAFTNTQQPGEWCGVRVLPIGAPNDAYPLGEAFERAALTVPHDVLIVQRHPSPLPKVYNSKLNYFWKHDLARKRMIGPFTNVAWNCQGIFAVTNWHAKQIADTYTLPNEYFTVIRNAIDQSLFESEPNYARKRRGKKLLYVSRPERGLENLVNPGAIMDQLFKIDQEITLMVAHYDNTMQEMEPLYRRLWERCEAMPNVELLGSLGKRQLAEAYYDAALLVYPTVPVNQHEETSCIAVMEAQAAGTPVVACDNGAIRETMGEGVDQRGFLIPYQKDGSTDIAAFVKRISEFLPVSGWERCAKKSRAHALKSYQWKGPAEAVEALVERTLEGASSNPSRLVSHLLYSADAVLAKEVIVSNDIELTPRQGETLKLFEYLDTAEGYAGHYNRSAELFHEYAGNGMFKGGGIQSMPQHQDIIPHIQALSMRGGGRVLDYGGGVGLFAMMVAEHFPNITVVLADIERRNVETCRKQVHDTGIKNITAEIASWPDQLAHLEPFDLVIAAEVIEHIREAPGQFADALEKLCNPDGRVIVTYPSTAPGIHERHIGEETRMENVRHIEHLDAEELWAGKRGFQSKYHGLNQISSLGAPVGGCVTTWLAGDVASGEIDKKRKLAQQHPAQTLSVCMISRWDEPALARALQSVREIADEIIIGIDTTGMTLAVEEYPPLYHVLKKYNVDFFALSDSPLEIGFDAARNETIDRASMDWILWIDADEELQYQERLKKYLRANPWEGYAVSHLHFSTEPKGLMHVDLPCRVFRNHKGLRFFGLVHEHPCRNVDETPKHIILLGDQISIAHGGYSNEKVRRTRFQRNIGLMKRDREKYPERTLGKFLWIRDIAHLNRYEFENNPVVTLGMRERASEGVELWRELVKTGNVRMAVDSLQYYGECVDLLQGGNVIMCDVGIAANFHGMGDNINGSGPAHVRGKYANRDDIEMLAVAMIKDKTNIFDEKYF